MTTPTALRERASSIRQVASGFADDVSRTLMELAEGLEAEARKLEEESTAGIVSRQGAPGPGSTPPR